VRVKAVISYDGSAFFGFQRQKSTKQTVTSAIEQSLRSLNIDARIVASGRTTEGYMPLDRSYTLIFHPTGGS